MIIALVKHLLLLTFFETLYVFCKNGPKFCQLGIPLFQKHQNFLYIWSFSAKNLQYFIYPELILHNWSHSKYVPTYRPCGLSMMDPFGYDSWFSNSSFGFDFRALIWMLSYDCFVIVSTIRRLLEQTFVKNAILA